MQYFLLFIRKPHIFKFHIITLEVCIPVFLRQRRHFQVLLQFFHRHLHLFQLIHEYLQHCKGTDHRHGQHHRKGCLGRCDRPVRPKKQRHGQDA